MLLIRLYISLCKFLDTLAIAVKYTCSVQLEIHIIMPKTQMILLLLHDPGWSGMNT